MKSVLSLLPLLLLTFSSFAQKQSKADKLSLINLRNHTSFLADDKLEGRRTGTKGEELAYQYIVQQKARKGFFNHLK